MSIDDKSNQSDEPQTKVTVVSRIEFDCETCELKMFLRDFTFIGKNVIISDERQENANGGRT